MAEEFELDDTEGLAQFNRLLPEARALPPSDVKTFRIDPVIALQNVVDGTRNLLEVGEERLRAELPLLDLDSLRGIVDLAIAVNYAARRAENMVAPGTLGLLAEATTLRAKLLTAAEALAASGLLPEAKVKKIRQGNGGIDRAKDCVELAALFKENADAIRGKSPVSAADVKRAAELGTQLLDVLKPKGSRRSAKTKEQREAIEDRDRLGTLLVRRYDASRRAAGWFFGAKADELVPPIGSIKRSKKKPKTTASS